MKTQFFFKGFEPTPELRAKVNLALDRVLGLAPYGSTVTALLEKQDNGFRCAVDLDSHFGPFMASAVGPRVEEAIEGCLENKLKRQIETWWNCRQENSWVSQPTFHVAS